jgi:O-succinylbenzoic acid--CoA ligase
MLGDWLLQRVHNSPGQMGLIYADQAWDYRAMNDQVDLLAERLAASGVNTGKHVAALLPNVPEAVFLVHALARLGAVLVPLNLRQTAIELDWQASQADCGYLAFNSQTQAKAAQIDAPGLVKLDLDELSSLPNTLPFQEGQTIEQTSDAWELDRVQAIIFTSGTTGKPKGARLTFGNHFYSAVSSAFRLGHDPQDRWLVTLPLFHVGGLAIIFRCCLYGTTLVLQDGFDPQAVLQAITDQNITLVSLVPTMLHRLLDLRSGDLPAGSSSILARLRCILLGGAPAPQSLLERSLAAGLNLALTYGMTETASQIATANPAETRRKPGSVGKPLLFCQVRILSEAGEALPNNQIGQIAVTGPIVMAGYYGDKGEQSMPDRELLTGDLGYLDEEDDLWMTQRRVDLIVSGGENVYPAEVEAVLLSHPQVDSACVVGIEHPEWGQQVAAAIVKQPGALLTELDLIAFCRQKLAGYKVPRRVIFLERLPQTETGKIIRQQAAALINDAFNGFGVTDEDFQPEALPNRY